MEGEGRVINTIEACHLHVPAPPLHQISQIRISTESPDVVYSVKPQNVAY